MDVLIRGGQVLRDGALYKEDIYIKGGLLAPPGDFDEAAGVEVFDASGCAVLPGFCDLHAHLREPGFLEKETIATGTAAAAAGGFTTVFAMPNVNPVPDSLENLEKSLEIIRRDARVTVHCYAAVTLGERGEVLADIEALAPLVAGFSDDGRGVQSEALMREAMRRAKACGRMVAAHCETEALLAPGAVCVQEHSRFAVQNGFIGHSDESEWSEVARDIRLCGETGAHLHICHASTAKTFALVREAKRRGLPVTCEVTPHNLLLCCDDIAEDNGRFKMNPPLRDETGRKAAVEALLDGTIDVVATDHAPHTQAEKAGGFTKALNGVTGFETAFAALYTGLVQPGVLPLARLAALMADEPRRVAGLPPAALLPGVAADLVVVDLECVRACEPGMFLSKGRSTPFAGRALAGWPVLTFAGGKLAFQRK